MLAEALPRFNSPPAAGIHSLRFPPCIPRYAFFLWSRHTEPPLLLPSPLQRGTEAVTALIDMLCFDGSERDGREIGAAPAVSAGIHFSFYFR